MYVSQLGHFSFHQGAKHEAPPLAYILDQPIEILNCTLDRVGISRKTQRTLASLCWDHNQPLDTTPENTTLKQALRKLLFNDVNPMAYRDVGPILLGEVIGIALNQNILKTENVTDFVRSWHQSPEESRHRMYFSDYQKFIEMLCKVTGRGRDQFREVDALFDRAACS